MSVPGGQLRPHYLDPDRPRRFLDCARDRIDGGATAAAHNVGRDRTGGGSATGIQRSPNLECPNFHMGVRLASNSCVEKTAKFSHAKIGISIA